MRGPWQVVDAPEVLTVIDALPHLGTFLNSLYDCKYSSFFKVHISVQCNFLCGALALELPVLHQRPGETV